ncbi:hypothetical protein NR798_26610 [Archangium gephyra]|uniref:hypothetical protein n=1 Tax=Archangium gephyra TaxID=48 RepID=UPI0035D3E1A3
MGVLLMVKSFGAVVVLGGVFALAGCGGAVDAAPEQELNAQLASTEQQVTNGVTNAACAQSLTLRSSPGGATIGTMYTNWNVGVSKFYVQSSSGGWSYGYSYSLGLWGYAMSYYLTTNYYERGTPGQSGYSFACTRSDSSGFGEG